jgi:hypothetical protein
MEEGISNPTEKVPCSIPEYSDRSGVDSSILIS